MNDQNKSNEQRLTLCQRAGSILRESSGLSADWDKWDTQLFALCAEADGEIERLRSALVKSVAVIQTWHNQGIPVRECSKLWDIYWRNAPEMGLIREALTALDGVSK